VGYVGVGLLQNNNRRSNLEAFLRHQLSSRCLLLSLTQRPGFLLAYRISHGLELSS